MKKPLIGLTASHDKKTDGLSLRSNYANALRSFGGLPVILPLSLSGEELEQLTDTLDGIVFTGGPDIHPFLFGEETLAGCGDMSPLRDQLELSLFSEMFKKQKPILGICRGAQLINIALGGTVYQDIPTQFHGQPVIAHSQPFSYQSPSHHIQVEPGTLLGTTAGNAGRIEANSMHHQAIRDTAPNLIVSGRSVDGLTEAVEMPGYPFLLGVQWHPEYLCDRDECAVNIFRMMIHACV